MNAGQLLENIRNFEMPPPDPREEKINTLNDKMDVMMDTFRQTLEAQKARQDADEMARQDAAESRGPIDVGYDPKAGRSQSYPANYGNIQAPPPPPMPVTETVFDPEGVGYDYETAEKYGITPDESGHWPSRVPEPGQILKGRGHETFDKTAEGEKQAGYEIVKGEDGKYYSQKKKSPYSYELSPVEIVKLGTNVPNDKILSAPVYESFEEMNADFNDALRQGFPLPPVVFADGREVVVAEMEQLKRFVMSADDIKMYNLMIVDETAKEYQQLEE